MLPSVRAFLSGIIDYAGLFPPAKLPLDETIRNYARYRTEAESWMLGRFVIPAARLAELEPYVHLFSSESPVPFAVLGCGGETVTASLNGITADVEALAHFRFRHGSGALVDTYEVKLPASALPSPAADLLQAPARALRRIGLSAVYEVPAAAPAELFRRMRGGAAGVKLRCGGLEPAAFPSPEQVAAVIAACHDNGLALKFTAGLHHPLRHLDAGINARMHGFLNVFFAGMLAPQVPNAEGLVPILEDEEASHFVFDADGIRWRDLRVPLAEIVRSRREAVLSFGSCSFDEPRDDLRAMGLLS
jgi:hypothetical protein